jgi:N-acetylglucosaminyldiphosphoundecaprenol N-acetyl-beta-D-mannosaminyltransferase
MANVLGIGVHALSISDAVDAVANAVELGQKGYVCVASVHGIMEARRDPSVARIFQRAFLVVPDGMPTVWMGRSQGLSMTRVFGPDLMLAVLQEKQLARARHFLYGGAPGVAKELEGVLVRKCPGVQIVGSYCPPFRPLSPAEQCALINKVARSHPDIIWVGLSTPKQERFMAEYLPRLATTLMVGVGAAFDFHTGRISDSPAWVKHLGLQWVHRLAQDPLRLWRRYLLNNPPFAWNAILQLLGVKTFPLAAVQELDVTLRDSDVIRCSSL